MYSFKSNLYCRLNGYNFYKKDVFKLQRCYFTHIFLDTASWVTSPLLSILSPITDYVLGPSPPQNPTSELGIYPLFGPITTCFVKNMHAPFTVVLNKPKMSGRFLQNGE